MRGESRHPDLRPASATLIDDDSLEEPPMQQGARIDRYVVLGLVGGGAMGVVYAAWDPKLDRKVAVKLLKRRHGAAGSIGATRLVREARALAKVSHPNVVAVHDADVHEDHVFVAMEFVDGTSLTRWLHAEERTGGRPWREIVDAFIQAGRGLAAAHAAGVVHRDFKPENVLVGRDGRVCVADFGLAAPPGTGGDRRARGARTAEGDATTAASTSQRERSSDEVWMDGGNRLTRTGAVMGTPIYMSPEQHLNTPVDARSDQYSFCASLYEALYGDPPFTGDDYTELWTNVAGGRVRQPPRDSLVPAWVRRVVMRGLAWKPDDRYPNIEALLAELSRAGERRRWRRTGALAAIGVGGLAAWGLAASWLSRPDPCAAVERHLSGVWDEERRKRTRAAFAATELPFADRSWTSTSEVLDRYTSGWLGMRRAACEATHVHREQSEDLLDRRMACLDGKLRRVRAVVDLFDRADAGVVSTAVQAVDGLPALEECADTERLLGGTVGPVGESADMVAAADEAIAKASALRITGKHELARQVAEEAVDLARAAKAPRLEADALFESHSIAFEQKRSGDAEARLLEAIDAADRSGHDEQRAFFLGSLSFLLAYGGHAEDALRWLRQADAVAAHAHASAAVRARIDQAASVVLGALGRHTDAIARGESALALAESASGSENLGVAYALDWLASAYDKAGDSTAAVVHYRRAIALVESRLGPDHPVVAGRLSNLAKTLMFARQYDEAEATGERALAIYRAALGDAHPEVALTLGNLAALENRRGNATAALARHREQLAILERTVAHDDILVARAQFNMGVTLQNAKQHAESIAAYRRAIEIFQSRTSADNVELAAARLGLGGAMLALGQRREVIELLEDVLSVLERKGQDPFDLAEARWVLARALPEEESRRAENLARLAREGYGSLGDPMSAEIDAWLFEKSQLR